MNAKLSRLAGVAKGFLLATGTLIATFLLTGCPDAADPGGAPEVPQEEPVNPPQ